jgi:hypothetical protein
MARALCAAQGKPGRVDSLSAARFFLIWSDARCRSVGKAWWQLSAILLTFVVAMAAVVALASLVARLL